MWPKTKFYVRTLPLVAGSVILVMQFQNCAQNLQGEDVFSSMSNASTIDQLHEDYSHGTDIPKEPEKALEVTKSMMDRMTLYSFFLDTMGPDAAALKSLKRLKTEKAIFGGPCSVYNNFKSARAGLKIDPDATPCANKETATDLAAPAQPSGNVLQQALINDVCTEAVADSTVGKKTYKYLAAQLKEKASVAVPANTPENALKLFSLFYRGKPLPPPQLVESLQFLVGYPATDDGWKTAILTTCVSSHWQAL